MASERNPETNALTLRWAFGFNYDISGGVHNLADGSRRAIFYSAAHTGIIYDLANQKQRPLQGHVNPIQSTCTSADKRWVITADIGSDCMIVIWDSYTATPIRTIFQPHPHGVVAMDLAADSTWLVTLSYVAEEGEPQYISVWDWTAESPGPVCTSEITARDLQTLVRFNPSDKHQIVTNGQKRVIFWNCDSGSLKFYSPPISSREIKQAVGLFTQTLFIPGTSQAVSGTQDGDMVLWDQVFVTDDSVRATDKKAVKIVRVHQGPINVLALVSQFIVTGGQEGFVRFFDFKLRVVAWFEDLNAGPIRSIGFARVGGKTDSDHNGYEQEFEVPEFVVATTRAVVIRVESNVFQKLKADERKGDTLIVGQEGPIMALAAHPFSPIFAVTGHSGMVQLWDYDDKKVLGSKRFDKLHAQCLAFDANARYLAVGFTNGTLKILRMGAGDRLDEMHSFRESKDCVTMARFSPDVKYLATSDLDRSVVLYRFEEIVHEFEKARSQWIYVGKARAHYNSITELVFGTTRENKVCLLSIGRDRSLVEYDLDNSSISKGVVIKEITKIEQTAVPMAMVWACNGSAWEDTLITVNDHFKFKIFSAADKMCRRTLLGPTYGRPLTRMTILPGGDDRNPYMSYSTGFKVIGLVKMPLDGNPNKAMGMIAHPGEVTSMVCSHDGRYLITSGGADCTVNLWAVDTRSLDATMALGGQGMEPYLALIEGGAGGEFHQEIIDFFYYAQLRSQGEDTTNPREIPGTVPLSEVANLMRALGFYPTEREVDDMLNEIRYSRYDETNEFVTDVDLDTIIKVYVNHRPLAGIGKTQIQEAFRILGADPTSGLIDRDSFINALKTQGEAFSEAELTQCLIALIGVDNLDTQLDTKITASDFSSALLAFDDADSDANTKATSQAVSS